MIDIRIAESKKCNGEWSLYVTFPYNDKIVEVVRGFSSRFWDKENKEWELPFKCFKPMIDSLPDFDFDIHGNWVAFAEKKKVEMPVGFEFKTKPFNHQIEGFEYGLNNDRWLLGDEQGLGKALALDTKVFTPNGYKLMKDIQVGDYVFSRSGKPTKVTAVYNHSNIEMYRITFSDGVQIECCKDHLWQIHDQHGVKVVDTKWFTEKNQFGKIRKDNLFSVGSGSYMYWIDRCDPVQFEYQNVPINPYVLGALLGDGGLTSNSISFTTADDEMIHNMNERLRDGYRLNSSKSMSDIDYNIVGVKGKTNTIKQDLSRLGLFGTTSHTKFIPNIYKYNSIAVRTEVLQGLIDTDGYATKDNLLQFATVSKQLCDDVRFLVESLGGIVSYSERDCGYGDKITGRCYTLTIKFDRPQLYCTLTRKKSLLKDRHFKTRRNIVAVERIENADAKCITVDNDEHLYLIDHFIVTHNTKQVIDIAVAKKIQKGYKHCLIICGVNGLKWNWVNEIRTHSEENVRILGQRYKGSKIYIGSMDDKLSDVKALFDKGEMAPYFLITNVETLRNETITKEIQKLCKNETIGIVAIDEVHKCKNPTSQQGKGILKLQPECRIAMTGTPLMNSPFDLYIILKWLGYEKHSFYQFKQHYGEFGGYGGYQVMGYRYLNELQSQLDDIMLRRLKADVLDLPEKTHITEYVEMTPKQAQIYDEVTADIKMNIDQIKMANNPLAELIRMRQATGYTGILSSKVKESAKLDRMEELVDEAIENGKKVVIFSNWTQMTLPIYNRLAVKYHGTYITGEVDSEQRQEHVRRFQEDSDCKFIVGTIGAMGTGLTLTAGTVEIFMDEPWNRANKEQAEDRLHRIGQATNITIYTLICKDTIDERVHELVENKGKMADMLVDGKITGNKSELLDFLLS